MKFITFCYNSVGYCKLKLADCISKFYKILTESFSSQVTPQDRLIMAKEDWKVKGDSAGYKASVVVFQTLYQMSITMM